MPYPFSKQDITQYLEDKKIGTRNIIGNVFLSESYKDVFKIEDELINSDYIHNNSFVIGCNPAMRQEHIDYISKCIGEFLSAYE